MKMNKNIGKVDTVCGGQMGDEGKGAIAAYLISHKEYSFTARVGGYNAEHRYSHAGKEYTGRVLPCGLIKDNVKLFLGAGHLFSISALKHEIESMKIDKSRILIDRNAGIVTGKHMEASANADRSKRGGTTGRGAGKAAVDKVLRDGAFKTAGDYSELLGLAIGNVSIQIRTDLNGGKFGLLEGSQGALLSIDHGYYPFCCAKNVTPAGILAEMGVEIGAVREIFVVYRTFPMRVPGKSGPAGGKELTWTEVEARIRRGLSGAEKRQTLSDGTKGEYERIFEWDWKDFIKSLTLCGPTKMVLTFADWLNPDDNGTTKFSELSAETRGFVARMEEVAGKVLRRKVPVALIKTGVEESSIITR